MSRSPRVCCTCACSCVGQAGTCAAPGLLCSPPAWTALLPLCRALIAFLSCFTGRTHVLAEQWLAAEEAAAEAARQRERMQDAVGVAVRKAAAGGATAGERVGGWAGEGSPCVHLHEGWEPRRSWHAHAGKRGWRQLVGTEGRAVMLTPPGALPCLPAIPPAAARCTPLRACLVLCPACNTPPPPLQSPCCRDAAHL